MKNNYFKQITSVLSVFGILSLTAFNSFSQCSANAGEGVQNCTSGPITLTGSFTIESEPVPTLDINQDQMNTCMANFNQTGIAQSFTATSATICGAGLSFESSAFGTLVINLWTALPNAGGTLLATGSAMVENASIGNVYWNSVPLTVGTVYFLEFTSSAPQITTCIAGSTVNPYPGGYVHANSGFQEYTNFDYTFRTFTCAPIADVSWEGPNITAGANTTTPTINPPVGEHTYTLTVVDLITNCTITDEVVVTRGENVTNEITEIAVDSYTWNDITYTEGGQYTQTFETSLGCDSTVTLILNMDYTNIETYSTSLVKIYPNPTQNLITIEFEATFALIEVLDASGRTIQSTNITSGQSISLENETTGVFFLRLTTDQSTSVHRIVKQ